MSKGWISHLSDDSEQSVYCHNQDNKNKPFKILTQEEYTSLIVDSIERLPAHMVIHRLTGDGKRDELVGPMWSLKKWEVLNAIDDELKKRNSYQGVKYNK